MFNPIPNHVEQALARLITQYRNSPNLQNFLTAIVQPIQTIESALTDMNNLRYLNQAQGVQLDVIGVIVGLTRPGGMSDDEYRLELKGQIQINISEGEPEKVIQAFLLFTGAPEAILTEFHNASLILSSSWNPSNQAQIDQMMLTLKHAIAAGVRLDGIITYDETMAFAYDGGLPGLGYDDGTQNVGGKYAALHQYIGGGFAYDGDDSSGMGYGTLLDPLVGGAYLT